MASALIVTQIPCQLCKIDKIIWKCFNCKLLMCDKCKSGVHHKIAKDHKIIETRELKSDKKHSFKDIKCQEHGEQSCCLFCKRCNTLICVECMAKIHNGHEVIVEEEYDERKLIDQLEQKCNEEGSDYGETPSKNLVQQNIELRRKLEEEHQSYKRKLMAYQDGQQRQAQLVQKLQAKLLQYTKICTDYETRIHSQSSQVEQDNLKTEKKVETLLLEKEYLEKSMARLHDKNCDLEEQVQKLQAQLTEAEQQHTQMLNDVTSETGVETGRHRTAQNHSEKILGTREITNSYCTKIRVLEETIATLQDQLSRQLNISHIARTGDEIRDIRSMLDSSLSNVTRDQSLDPLIMETETRTPDNLEFRGSYRTHPRLRTPKKYSDRLTSAYVMRRTQSPIALRKKLSK